MISTSEKLGFNQPVFSDVTAKTWIFQQRFKRFRKQQKYLFVASTYRPLSKMRPESHRLPWISAPFVGTNTNWIFKIFHLVTLIGFKILEMINEKIWK